MVRMVFKDPESTVRTVVSAFKKRMYDTRREAEN